MKKLSAWHVLAGSFALLYVVKGGRLPEGIWAASTLMIIGFISGWRSYPSLQAWHWAMVFIVLTFLALLLSPNFFISLPMVMSSWLCILLGLWASGLAAGERRAERWLIPITLLGLHSAAVTLFQVYAAQATLKSSSLQIYGWFSVNPTFNAVWLASVASACLAFAVDKRPIERPYRWTAMASVLVCVLALGMGSSRSAFLALGLGFGVALWPRLGWRGMIWSGVAAFSSLLLFVSLLSPQQQYSRLRLNEGNYRNQLWQVAAKAIGDRPWRGWGPGNFEAAYQRHGFPVETDPVRYSRTTAFAHNEFLQIGADYGLPTLFFVLIFIGYGIRQKWLYSDSDTPIAVAGLIPIFFSALWTPIWHIPFLASVTVLWGLLTVQPRTPSPKHSAPRLASVAWGILLGMLFVGSGWASLISSWNRNEQWARLVRFCPAYAESWRQLGFRQKNAEQAIPYFLEAVHRSPHDVYAQEALAQALEAVGTTDSLNAALAERQAAIKEAPNRAINYLACGRILYRFKKWNHALSYFQKARQLEPHYWEADVWIARIAGANNRPQIARFHLQHLRKRYHDYLTYRSQMASELPSIPYSSPYESVITAYDEEQVEEWLRQPLSPQFLGVWPNDGNHLKGD